MKLARVCRVVLAAAVGAGAAWAALPKPLESEPVAKKLEPSALDALERDAAAGRTDAQLELGLAHDDGSAGTIDRVKAAHWYERAAQNGVAVAHLRLGMLFEDGSAGRQSYSEAREHYERAVAGGVPEANLRLGILHLEGWGVARDPKAAVVAIEKAAKAGYQPAELVLSDMYAVGIGVRRDPARAIAWAEKVAAQKSPEGEVRLASLAMRRGLPRKDFQLAREWYQLSAEKEYTGGMLGMAATFLRPNQTAADREIGVRWLRLAADNGNRAAAFYLAGFLLWGAPGAPGATEEEARRWLQNAADRGEAAATEVLDLAEGGRLLREAFRHVMTVPFSDRYVQRYDEAKIRAQRDPNGTHQPMPTKLVRPVYPPPLRLTNVEGDVIVDFLVDTTGRVRNAYAIKSAHPAFAERAVEAVRQWAFIPGRKRGAVVTTHMQVPVYFRLSEVRDGAPRDAANSPEPR